MILMLKNPIFYIVKIPYQQLLIFLSFMNIFRNSRLQMFFNLGAIENYTIFLIKKRLQHRCFPVNIAKIFRRAFFTKL